MSRFEIVCGDCLEEMAKMPDGCVDVIITSPPYNLKERPKSFGRMDRKGARWSKSQLMTDGYDGFDDAMPYNDYKAWQRKVLDECLRILSPIGVMFYNHKPRIFKGELRLPTAWAEGLPLRQIIIWDRCGGMNANLSFYQPTHEWIMMFVGPKFGISRRCSTMGDVWRIPPEINSPHPAPFPLELPMKALCSLGDQYRTVSDPFAGRGTVGIAANRTGRDFIGIEQSAAYCDIARQWHEAESGQFSTREFGGLFAEAQTPSSAPTSPPFPTT